MCGIYKEDALYRSRMRLLNVTLKNGRRRKLKSKVTDIKSKIIEILKNSNTRRYILLGVAVLCIGLMVVGAVQVIRIQLNYRQSAALYEELTRYLCFDSVREDGNQEGENGENGEEEEDFEETFTLPPDVTLPVVDFDSLREINSNVVGWIILEGTQINYPVVHGDTNYQYLHHLFDGTFNPSGSIFVDAYNAPGFREPNTIIYGHHMNDGQMFAALEFYRSQQFFDENPYIFLLTPERDYVIKVFSGFVADPHQSTVSWRYRFRDEDDVAEWLTYTQGRSEVVSNMEVLPSQRFVTLSTCNFDFWDARYVVVGRLMPIAR